MARLPRLTMEPFDASTGMTADAIASAVGVAASTVRGWRARGISVWVADLLAVQVCGVHPYAIWGSQWVDAAWHDMDQLAAA